jgi:hypothetical protein
MGGLYWIFSVSGALEKKSRAPVNNEIQFERRCKTSTSCNTVIFDDF